jgi:GNAT superfamily N-acetyltransferase
MKPLPSGCILRPLSPADEPALLEFFRSHSEETIFQRYHHLLDGINHQRAMALLGVDQQRDIALAVLRRVAGAEQIVAIGRYYTDPGGGHAELAVVVRESMRRLGIATRLLHALGAIARGHGLYALRAQVLSSNAPMRNLLRPYASQVAEEPGLGTACFLLPVSALAGSPAPSRPPRKRPARR